MAGRLGSGLAALAGQAANLGNLRGAFNQPINYYDDFYPESDLSSWLSWQDPRGYSVGLDNFVGSSDFAGYNWGQDGTIGYDPNGDFTLGNNGWNFTGDSGFGRSFGYDPTSNGLFTSNINGWNSPRYGWGTDVYDLPIFADNTGDDSSLTRDYAFGNNGWSAPRFGWGANTFWSAPGIQFSDDNSAANDFIGPFQDWSTQLGNRFGQGLSTSTVADIFKNLQDGVANLLGGNPDGNASVARRFGGGAMDTRSSLDNISPNQFAAANFTPEEFTKFFGDTGVGNLSTILGDSGSSSVATIGDQTYDPDANGNINITQTSGGGTISVNSSTSGSANIGNIGDLLGALGALTGNNGSGGLRA